MGDNKCSKCKQPVRGHVGPCGVNCPAQAPGGAPGEDVEVSVNTSTLPSSGAGQATTGDADVGLSTTLLQQLVQQMTALNTGIASIATGQEALMQQFGGSMPQGTVSTEQATPGAGAAVPDARQAAVIRGEFIDFELLLPNEFSTPTEKPSVGSDKKEKSKRITNFLTWLQAWSEYERLVMHAKPESYTALAEYRCLIQDCDVKYTWSYVYSYDVKFRSKLANNSIEHRFDFNKIDTGLFVTILDATAVKPSKVCYRCQSSSHVVAKCPFPATASLEANKKAPGSTDIVFYQGREICNNFQTGHCRFNYSCRRAHMCRQCYGPQPLYMCDTCRGRRAGNTGAQYYR